MGYNVLVPTQPVSNSRGNLGACLDRMARGVAFRSELMGKSDAAGAGVPYAGPLLDAMGLFERLSIGYALIGGVASMYYGRARFTEDVDFVAASGHAEALAANPDAMKTFRFDPGCTWKLYHESGVDIDIGKDEHTDGIVARARAAPLAGRVVRVADPHDLIAMKLRAGRIQDDYDISEIMKGTAIDEALVASRVTAEEMERFREIVARGR